MRPILVTCGSREDNRAKKIGACAVQSMPQEERISFAELKQGSVLRRWRIRAVIRHSF